MSRRKEKTDYNRGDLSDWSDIILGKPMCTSCKKRCSIVRPDDFTKTSTCCGAGVEYIKCTDPRWDNI